MTGTSRPRRVRTLWVLTLAAVLSIPVAAPRSAVAQGAPEVAQGAPEEVEPAAEDAQAAAEEAGPAAIPSLETPDPVPSAAPPTGPSSSEAAPEAIPAAEEAADDGWLDGFNRGSREFNFWVFDHVLEPAARGYNFVMPKWGQQRIQNFFENLERPRDIVNSLLQGKGRRAGNHTAAFLMNTTAGLAGLFVISDRFIDIEPPETTNETLGFYGIPPGPYLVVPLYGESCPRCLLGSLGDAALYPIFWIPGQAGMYAGIGARGLNAVNLVAKQMPGAFASDSEWAAYHERLHDRHAYEEAKRLFFENQELDVAD